MHPHEYEYLYEQMEISRTTFKLKCKRRIMYLWDAGLKSVFHEGKKIHSQDN